MRHFFSFLLVVVLVCSSASATAQTPCHPDFDALMALYNSTNGVDWNTNDGWVDGAAGTDCNVCDWFGVRCNDDGRVQSLFLTSNNMIGPIPPELGDLTYLESLDLGGSGLTGSIPPEVGELTRMKRWAVCCSNLSGQLPDISTWVELEYFSVVLNKLSGPVPDFSAFENTLTALYLGLNNFTGPFPEVGNATALVILECESNSFDAQLPVSYTPTNLPALEQLLLQNNNIEQTLPESWGGFSNLRRLDLSENRFHGELPASWGALTECDYIDLSDNDLQGCYPGSWATFCALTDFLFNFNFTGNPLLPDGGSHEFFTDEFCDQGTTCEECPTDLVITSSADIDNFVAFYPYCRFLRGNVTVDGYGGGKLDSLNRLREVSGTVTYRNLPGGRLRGLDSLRSIGSLRLINCPQLFRFGGPGSTGMLALETISATLEITDAPLLADLSGLAELQVADRISLKNTGLVSLEDLRAVGNVRYLLVQDNDELLRLWDGNANRSGNVNSWVLDSFYVVENPVITDISGGPIADITLALLLFINPLLADCATAGVCSGLNNNNIPLVLIAGNDGQCDSRAAVEAACLALPVTWVDFTATIRQKSVDLTWTTSDEENNAGFTVQRSPDGHSWTDLTDIAPVASAPDGLHHYTWTDDSPLFGETLYRLRQRDLDGATSFSAVRSVVLRGAGQRVFPNPAGETFDLVAEAGQTVTMYTADGRLVRTIRHTGARTQVPRDGLKSGVYWLRFSAGGEVLRLALR